MDANWKLLCDHVCFVPKLPTPDKSGYRTSVFRSNFNFPVTAFIRTHGVAGHSFRIPDKPSGGELITGFERCGDFSPTTGLTMDNRPR